MSRILHIIDHGDFCSLLLLIAILSFLGAKMVETSPNLSLWGVRLADATFIAYCIYAGCVLNPVDAQAWLFVVLRALLAAGLVLGVAWILLAAAAFVRRYAFDAPACKARELAKAAHQQERERQHHREQREIDRLRAEQEAVQQSQQLEHAAAETDATRRRTDARAAAALSYGLFAPKIGNRFTHEMLDEFVAKYMTDDHSPEDVERRGQELISALQRHLEEVEPPEEKRTLEDLARWFQQQKERIEALPIDDRVKRVHIAELTARYAELSSRLLQDLQP